jgi:hypothetical protein
LWDMRDKQYHHRDVQRKLVDPCTIGSTSFSHCVGCNWAAVDVAKYRTTWSAVDGRPFTRINTVPVDDRAKTTRWTSEESGSIRISFLVERQDFSKGPPNLCLVELRLKRP